MLPGMITVHHLETSRSQRVLWLLEELGVPYELKIYKRNPVTRLAPPELKKIHPLGKSPVITDGDLVVAESAAILEYLVERYGAQAQGEAANLTTQPGTPEHMQARFWMHFAEGSLMNWLVMKLVFMTIPTQPMPFFVKPIAREICKKVQKQLIDPNLSTSTAFMEEHLSKHSWFAGDRITLAEQDERERRDEALRIRELRQHDVGRPGPCHRPAGVADDHGTEVGFLFVLLHVEAVTAAQHLPVDVAQLVARLVHAVFGELH